MCQVDRTCTGQMEGRRDQCCTARLPIFSHGRAGYTGDVEMGQREGGRESVR